MIRAYRWSETSPEALEPSEIERPQDGTWLWLDLANEDTAEVHRIAEVFGISEPDVAEAIASRSLPMLEARPDYLFVVVRVLRSEAGERLGTAEVDVFLGPDFVITVHGAELSAFGWMHDRIAAGAPLPPLTPALLLAYLATAGSRRYVPLTQELEMQIDRLEDLALTADPRTLTEAHALRRDVIVLRRVLAAQREVYDDLTETIHPVLDESSRGAFDKVVDHQTHILDSIESARAMLNSVLETHRGAVADQTNEIVRVLTVFSAVLLPLSVLAGMWGMNFVSIPGAEEGWGFWIMVGVMAALAIGFWVYFARRGFIGAPRLRELPKSLGLGLIQIGTAPIRAVAEGIEQTIKTVGRTDTGENPAEE